MLANNEDKTVLRVSDIYAAAPAITGKVELVYEGEQEGAQKVAISLINKAIRSRFVEYFPDPERAKRDKKKQNPYQEIIDWFSKGNEIDLMRMHGRQDYEKALNSVPGLKDLVKAHVKGLDKSELLVYMEFVLHGLAEFSQISKHRLERGVKFKDMLGGILSGNFSFEDDDDDE